MLLETRVTYNVAEGVLHRYAVGVHYAVCVDVNNVDVVERVDKVSAREGRGER
jgi:hypothetical protein